MAHPPKPNIAVRAIIVKEDQLLLVNGDGRGDFWCAPGGRLEYAENLLSGIKREVKEETGLEISVGEAFAVSEFLYEENKFHNIDVFFRCHILKGEISNDWKDIGGPVVDRKFFSLEELQHVNVFPRWLRDGEWLKATHIGIYKGQDKK